MLKTNCKDETAGAEHGIFLDLDRSFSPSITSAAKKRVMMFFVEISDFFETIPALRAASTLRLSFQTPKYEFLVIAST